VRGSKLTPEQVQNWRRVLCGMIGPYALLMPDAEVQKIRDRFQQIVNAPMGRRSPAERPAKED